MLLLIGLSVPKSPIGTNRRFCGANPSYRFQCVSPDPEVPFFFTLLHGRVTLGRQSALAMVLNHELPYTLLRFCIYTCKGDLTFRWDFFHPGCYVFCLCL